MARPQIPENISAKELMAWNIQTRPSSWAQTHTTLRGQPYRFSVKRLDGAIDMSPNMLNKQRRMLQEPLDDQHHWRSTQKARQLGLSENNVRECLWFADTHDYTKQVYVFPTDRAVKDFSRTRIEETMKDSPYITRRMGVDPITGKNLQGFDPVDNVGLRKIGNSWIFFRSGATPKAGEGIDCDVVYFDEIDRMHPNVTIAFNETLKASNYGWRRDTSTPSLPGVGVNDSFERSDMRHWIIRCSRCNYFQCLIKEYPNCIQSVPAAKAHLFPPDRRGHQQTHYFQCAKCHEPLSDIDRLMGSWIALRPDIKNIRGYQLSQLDAPWISATEIMQNMELYKLEQLFVNYVIGLPYLGDNVLITEQHIRACIDTSMTNPYALKTKKHFVGGDWGNESWQVVGSPDPDNPDILIIQDLIHIKDSDKLPGQKDENPHMKRSAEVLRLWDADWAVYDAGYGKDRNWDLLKTFPGRVYSCYYPNNQTDYTVDFTDRWDANGMRVNVDRTLALKVMLRMFVDRQIRIPMWVVNKPGTIRIGGKDYTMFGAFIKHLTNLVSIKDINEDKDGSEQIVERIGSLPGGDHFGHAMNYLAIAYRKYRGIKRGKSMTF